MDNPSQQQIEEAQRIAKDHGLFFSEKKDGARTNYFLFRRTPGGNVLLGKRSSPSRLLSFVSKAASVH